MRYTTRSFSDLVKEKAEPDAVVRFWYGFVERYSSRALTRKSDRLPAAFGMATELRRLMPRNCFLAGLWESHLAESLLWRVSDLETAERGAEPTTTTVLVDFHVPSWSWASLDCAVVCDTHTIFGEIGVVATVVQYGIVLLSRQAMLPNSFVSCNRLRITGYLLKLVETFQKAASSDETHSFELYPDIPDPTTTDSETILNLPTLLETRPDVRVQQRKLSNATLLLPIMVTVHIDIVKGLLVNPSNHGANTFSRVGTFEAWFTDETHLRTIFPNATGENDGRDENFATLPVELTLPKGKGAWRELPLLRHPSPLI